MAAPGAPAAAASSGDGGQQAQQGGDAAQQHGNAQGPDLAELASRLDQFGEGQQELRDMLQSWQGGQQELGAADAGEAAGAAGAEGEFDGWTAGDVDFSAPDELSEAEMADPEAMAQAVEQSMQHAVQEQVLAAVEPIAQELADDRWVRDMQGLAGEFPELGDRETLTGVLNQTHAIAQALGVPHMGGHPELVRMTYLAGRALQIAQEEEAQEDAPSPAHLEGGGGAVPGGGARQDGFDRALESGRKSVLPW